MNILLSGISMSLGTAFMYYLVRVIAFTAAAALGIFLGYKFKSRKSKSDDNVKSTEE